ncbi:MAG: META domain-containing protein [Candidatus Methylumidiphilus sp.]
MRHLAIALMLALLSSASRAEPAAPALAEVGNAEVRGIFDGKPIRLRGGRYQGKPFAQGGASRPSAQLLDAPAAAGNLDGQPGEERVALISESSGGSGEHLYLAVFAGPGGKPKNIGTLLVGDRVKLRGLAVEGSTIYLDVVQAGPQDPSCCPTQLARLSYALEQGVLTRQQEEVQGTLSLKELDGVEWTAAEIDGQPLPAGGKRPTLQFKDGRIAGFGGCNRYMGQVSESAPGQITVGRLAGTLMACPPQAGDLERRFQASLGKATQYSFFKGGLLLSGMEGDKPRSVWLARP